MTKKPPTKKVLTKNTQLVAPVVWYKKPAKRTSELLARRPHRSFRRTRRRDYVRSLQLPGYFSFSNSVIKMLWSHRKIFLLLVVFYAILTAVLVGIASQDAYTTLTDTLKQSSGDFFKGDWGQFGQAGILFLSIITGSASQTLTEAQQVYASIIILLTWLSTVWLLRNLMAGKKVKLRDSLYNSSSPIVSTFLVALLIIVQLLPLAVALIGYSAASATGLLNGGIEAMLFWIVASLLAILSLYWMTSTLIALVVVTLPGMYPFRAIQTAGDLVVGRRVRILLRWLWMLLGIALTWGVVMLPVIIIDGWLKQVWPAISWLPTIPVVTLALSSLTVVWMASYVYMLYRKVVADEAGPV
jgi:hypothetical protein